MIAIVRVENTHTDNDSNSQSRKTHTQIMIAIVRVENTHR